MKVSPMFTSRAQTVTESLTGNGTKDMSTLMYLFTINACQYDLTIFKHNRSIVKLHKVILKKKKKKHLEVLLTIDHFHLITMHLMSENVLGY